MAAPVCVVTGASRGLGRAIALALGAQGARVAVNYASSSGAAEEVAAQIKEAGGDAIVVGANVGQREDIDKLFQVCCALYASSFLFMCATSSSHF